MLIFCCPIFALRCVKHVMGKLSYPCLKTMRKNANAFSKIKKKHKKQFKGHFLTNRAPVYTRKLYVSVLDALGKKNVSYFEVKDDIE